mmetsp:Transcript_124286/g.397878  ORF Transcript_124286/g.397878 Transcript_124286/m.397878 type:complete len:119 (-) Transcript_124286:66-422(-)
MGSPGPTLLSPRPHMGHSMAAVGAVAVRTFTTVERSFLHHRWCRLLTAPAADAEASCGGAGVGGSCGGRGSRGTHASTSTASSTGLQPHAVKDPYQGVLLNGPPMLSVELSSHIAMSG